MGMKQSKKFRAERQTIEMIIPEQVLIQGEKIQNSIIAC
jgi:hypothetical protein